LLQRQVNPEETVPLLRGDAFDINRRRQWHLALKRAVIDFERQHLHRATFVIGRLRRFAFPADDDALRLDRQVNRRPIDPGQINADADGRFAAERIDRGLPFLWSALCRAASVT
jgi:hypothetical protein